MIAAYDARLSLGSYRGMGRYLRMLISGRETELLGLCSKGESDPTLRTAGAGFGPYPLWEQFSLPRMLARHGCRILLAPYNTAPVLLPRRVSLVLVIHDLIFLEPIQNLGLSRSVYQSAGRFYRRAVISPAVRRAQHVLTVSEYTKQQILQRYSIPSDKIRVIPNSLGLEWFDHQGACSHREKVIFMVSGEAPSKNLACALEAFALYRRQVSHQQHVLRIAGVKSSAHARFRAIASRLQIEGAVEFLPYLNEAELREQYRKAELFLMPSLMEGFGIPVLEAMASGTPVAVSNVTSLPEVAGPAAQYFDPRDPREMASTIAAVLQDSDRREDMICAGYRQAAKFHPYQVRGLVHRFWDDVLQ